MSAPGVIGGLPLPPAPASTPAVAGLPLKPAPVGGAGSLAAAARPSTTPDFAADLAHLVALLGDADAHAPPPVSAIAAAPPTAVAASAAATQPGAEPVAAIDARPGVDAPYTQGASSMSHPIASTPMNPPRSTPNRGATDLPVPRGQADPAAGSSEAASPATRLRLQLTPPLHAPAARSVAAPDFATDLPRLLALLGAVRPVGSAPTAQTDPATDSAAESGASLESDPVVDALRTDVAMAAPVAAAPIAVPANSDAAIDPAVSTDRALAGVGADGRAPARSLQALPGTPGRAAAADADPRSGGGAAAQGPTPPLAPGVPAAVAAGAALAPAGVPGASPDLVPAGAVSSTAPADTATTVPSIAPLSADFVARPASSPHAVAASVVDTALPQAPRQLAETVAWHVPAQGAAEVRIRLNPEELGPLEVQLKLDGDKLSLRFDLADERVKDLVQSSLPSLSSMLSARGLQLEQAQVFTQQRDGQGGTFQQPATPALHSPESSENDAEVSAAAVRRPMVRQGLLDDYA